MLDCLTIEYVTNRLSRNGVNYQSKLCKIPVNCSSYVHRYLTTHPSIQWLTVAKRQSGRLRKNSLHRDSIAGQSSP